MDDSPKIFYRANGRAIDAIMAHIALTEAAQAEIQGFVMLCGAERALGSPQGITGLIFREKVLPKGWVRNAHAPLMAIPDQSSLRGKDLARKMELLRLPDSTHFSLLLGCPLADVMFCPSYEKDSEGWIISCPIDENGAHLVPPDSAEMPPPQERKPSLEWQILMKKKIAPSSHH